MWKDAYQLWLNQPNLEIELQAELKQKSDEELEDMFYTSLSFGTGGMRGILGAGINRLNIYTIRKANDGLSRYLLGTKGEDAKKRGVVIAHDNRRMSREFAFESAKVLGSYGIKSYLFEDLRPTPELSFATRYLHAIAGIVITASHNPPNYNGYKIYDEFGCQFTPDYANRIIELVNEVEDVFSISTLSETELTKQGLLEIIGQSIDDRYLDLVKTVQIHPHLKKDIKLVFTPLHGTSAMLASRLLASTGYLFYPVQDQMVPDPLFGTVSSPNPENPAAFQMAIELAKRLSADIIIATDPDADRLGVACRVDAEYQLLSGNQTGAILLYYLLNEKQKLGLLPKQGVVFNTIVTSDLGAKIARSFGFEVISTLTGFKFIGEQARLLENTPKQFVFGYEESFGYVINDGVRDKDALQALLLAAEAAAFYKEKHNQTLVQVLEQIYQEFGYHEESLFSIDLVGLEGKKRIDRIMHHFSKMQLTTIASTKVTVFEDFQKRVRWIGSQKEAITLPESDVLKYILEDGSWFVLRPSGTEPKLKVYVGSQGDSKEEAKLMNQKVLSAIQEMVRSIS